MAEREALEVLGVAVSAVDAALQRSLTEALAGCRPAAGRLVDLAVWWAACRGTVDADAPASAALLGLGAPAAGPVLQPPVRAVLSRPAAEVPADVPGAIDWGAATADAVADAGTELLLLSVRDAELARVLAALLMGHDPVEAAGFPTDRLDDAAWTALVVSLRDGLRRVRGLRGEPVRLLTALASPALAAGTAVVLQAAARRTPVVLDGYGALLAAVLARRVSRASTSWTLVAQADPRRHVQRAVTSLGATPVLDLGIETEDGTGGLVALALLETACGLLPPTS